MVALSVTVHKALILLVFLNHPYQSLAFISFSRFFSKKLLTKPPKNAVASRPFNQGIVRFAANLDFILGGMSYESN